MMRGESPDCLWEPSGTARIMGQWDIPIQDIIWAVLPGARAAWWSSASIMEKFREERIQEELLDSLSPI